MKKVLFILGAVILIICAFILLYPSFGKKPSKAMRQEYSLRTENYYYDGKKFFYPEEWSIDSGLDNITVSDKAAKPVDNLPVYSPDFSLANDDNVCVTWFGHSSLLLQMHGLNILIDPVFSDYASPVQFAGPKRFTKPSVTVDELPEIDVLILSHDHYDHLDMDAVKRLDSKVKEFIVPLGVENHLKKWGIDDNRISEFAWWESKKLSGGIEITCTPSRHFSGRKIVDSNMTSWCSWVIQDDKLSIFDSCDSAYGGHYEEIQKRFGSFDLVFMECGQYNSKWHYSHMYPEEGAIASETVNAKCVMPVHWGAFVLSNHGWDDSPERFTVEAKKRGLNVVTPHLSETFVLGTDSDYKDRWWRDYQ